MKKKEKKKKEKLLLFIHYILTFYKIQQVFGQINRPSACAVYWY